MSNLGFQGLFYNLVKVRNLHINRFFFNPKKNKTISPEKDFNLNQAKIILISLSFELDFINIIKILTSNNINPHTNKRVDGFIGVGGIFANLNPDFCLAFADIIFMGEFECYISNIIELCLLSFNKNRYGIIDLAHKVVENFIYRGSDDKIPICQPLKEPNFSNILTPNSSFSNTLLVEISRGCLFNCRFCIVPSIYGKIRFFDKNKLFKIFDMGLVKTSKVGLISTLTTEHPNLKEMVYYINKKGGKVSFSSLRVEDIDDELLSIIKDNGQNILTIAPEVASEKLKRKIRKFIKTETIINTFQRGIVKGIKKFKLYFIIGFEEENQEDLYSIVELVKSLRTMALSYTKELKYMPEIILSINQFIPKPHSKLEGEVFLNKVDIEKKIKYIKKLLLPLGITIKVDDYIKSFFQWYFGKGDKLTSTRIIDLIIENHSKKGLYRKIKGYKPK